MIEVCDAESEAVSIALTQTDFLKFIPLFVWAQLSVF